MRQYIGRLDGGLKLTKPRHLKNILNNERLKTAEAKLGEHYNSRDFLKAVCHTFNLSNKSYFRQLEEALEEDEIRGDDGDVSEDEPDEPDDAAAPNLPAPEDLFHQDEDDIEVVLTRPQTQGE